MAQLMVRNLKEDLVRVLASIPNVGNDKDFCRTQVDHRG